MTEVHKAAREVLLIFVSTCIQPDKHTDNLKQPTVSTQSFPWGSVAGHQSLHPLRKPRKGPIWKGSKTRFPPPLRKPGNFPTWRDPPARPAGEHLRHGAPSPRRAWRRLCGVRPRMCANGSRPLFQVGTHPLLSGGETCFWRLSPPRTPPPPGIPPLPTTRNRAAAFLFFLFRTAHAGQFFCEAGPKSRDLWPKILFGWIRGRGSVIDWFVWEGVQGW